MQINEEYQFETLPFRPLNKVVGVCRGWGGANPELADGTRTG